MNNIVRMCFLAYFLFYIPLIYLSNSTVNEVAPNAEMWGRQLAILPVSTFVSCIAAVFLTLVTGWYKTWYKEKEASIAAIKSSPFTAAILSFVPLAYAISPPDSILSTLTTMKSGSLIVSVSKTITKAKSSSKIKLAVGACVFAILLGVMGKLFDIKGYQLIWKGIVIGFSVAGMIVAFLYVIAYSGRLHYISEHKKSVAFFSLEHLLAPFIAVGIMWLASSFVPSLALGFTLWSSWKLWALGACSQAVGLAGGWILVAKELSSVGMLLNRSAAVLSGLTLTLLQTYQKGLNGHTAFELLSAGVILAVLATLPSDKNIPSSFASAK